MSSIRATEWRGHLADLINALRTGGDLTDPRWVAAFEAVPRHVFTPHVLDLGRAVTDDGRTEARQTWLSRVYQDDSLVIATGHHAGLRTDIPTSSSTRPGLMARMLELLDMHDGMRVLEVGTGTGYNAGLLSHRLDARNVTSVDVDPVLVDHARAALHGLNLAPHLVVGDGTAGVPDRAPFDRIMATCAVPAIPLPWITQLVPGGRMLVNLRGEIAGGTLCLLTKDPDGDDEAIGPFLDVPGHFMWARHDPTQALPYELVPSSERDHNRIVIDPDTVRSIADDVANSDFRFLVQLHLRGIRTLVARKEKTDTAIHAETIDGAWTRATASGQVAQGGPRRLWDSICTAHMLWRGFGQPAPTRFGVVANPTTQFAYLDHDDEQSRWPLPLL